MTTRPRPPPPARAQPTDPLTGWDHAFNVLGVVVLVAFTVGVVLVPALRAWLYVMIVGAVLLWLYRAIPTMLSTRPHDVRSRD